MSEYTTVAKVGAIEEGKGEAYAVNGRMVAIFLDQGKYFAIDDFCPHMGASLAGGPLQDGTVSCPWHAWRFCIKDGRWVDNPRLKVACYEVKVEGEDVLVRAMEEPEQQS